MKKLFAILSLGLLMVSCGGNTKSAQDETITPEQEQAIVDSLSTQIENERVELEQTTNENLAEIDSLLENF